jgi:hypothetical protein
MLESRIAPSVGIGAGSVVTTSGGGANGNPGTVSIAITFGQTVAGGKVGAGLTGGLGGTINFSPSSNATSTSGSSSTVTVSSSSSSATVGAVTSSQSQSTSQVSGTVTGGVGAAVG